MPSKQNFCAEKKQFLRHVKLIPFFLLNSYCLPLPSVINIEIILKPMKSCVVFDFLGPLLVQPKSPSLHLPHDIVQVLIIDVTVATLTQLGPTQNDALPGIASQIVQKVSLGLLGNVLGHFGAA